MKNIRKIKSGISVLLLVCMLSAFTAPVFAEDPSASDIDEATAFSQTSGSTGAATMPGGGGGGGAVPSDKAEAVTENGSLSGTVTLPDAAPEGGLNVSLILENTKSVYDEIYGTDSYYYDAGEQYTVANVSFAEGEKSKRFSFDTAAYKESDEFSEYVLFYKTGYNDLIETKGYVEENGTTKQLYPLTTENVWVADVDIRLFEFGEDIASDISIPEKKIQVIEDKSDADYAVILRSHYDAELDKAYVKLGFADDTEGTYEIGKLFTQNYSDPFDTRNDLVSDFNLNAYVGMVVSCKILDDGTVDLSGQNFKDNNFLENYAGGSEIVGYYDENGNYNVVPGAYKNVYMGIYDGRLEVQREVYGVDDASQELVSGSSSRMYYPYDEDTVVFALYGRPGYEADGSINVNHDDGYMPLKSRAFKMSELVDMNYRAIDNLYVNVGGNGMLASDGIGHVVLNSDTAVNKYVVAASMSVGDSTSGIRYQQTNSLAYVVSATQKYNVKEGKYYAEMKLINEAGLIEAATVYDVKDLNNCSVLESDYVGAIDGPYDIFRRGSFVRFAMNEDGKISVIEPMYDEVKTGVGSSYYSQGMYLVNIVASRNGAISFYDVDSVIEPKLYAYSSLEMHEEGCDIIGIDDDEYIGGSLTKVSKYENMLPADIGNAVIQIEEGQIVRIFSFVNGYIVGEGEASYSFNDLSDFDEIEEATADVPWNFTYGAVTYYNEEKDTIRIIGAHPVGGVYNISGLEIRGDIAADTPVVCYKDGENCVVEAVATVTGAVEDFTTDGGAVIDGKTYYLWPDSEAGSWYSSFFEYWYEEKTLFGENTKYHTFGDMVLEIEFDNTPASAESYAVVLRSFYDADMDTAYVKLAFADGTEGTYKVGKLCMPKPNDLARDENNLPQEFTNNTLFGVVVKYEILPDGSVDLSGQDFDEIFWRDYAAETKLVNYGAGNGVVNNGKFMGKYAYNDDSVIFALYGNPCMVKDYSNGLQLDPTQWGYAPVKAKAYKLSELKNLDANVMPGLMTGVWADDGAITTTVTASDAIGSYVLNSVKNANSYIVAAAITVGETLADGCAAMDGNAQLAYVVDAEQLYNMSSDKMYAKLTLVNENGLFTLTTVEDVKTWDGSEFLSEWNGVTKLDWLIGMPVFYELDKTGKIRTVDKYSPDGMPAQINTQFDEWNEERFYLVNVLDMRSGALCFFDTSKDIGDINSESPHYAPISRNNKIVGIGNKTYEGEKLAIVHEDEELSEGVGNAIIYINEDGEIERIFSFTNGLYSAEEGKQVPVYNYISYNTNDGSGKITRQPKPIGASITLSELVPMREGYTFKGWAESADATQALYLPGDAYSADKDITLYAVWESSAIIGDANGDGDVDFVDAMLVLKHDAGVSELSGDALAAADANGDGNVDFVDAIMILKYDAGLIEEMK